MTIYDYLVILIFAFFIIRGFWKGFVSSLLGLLSFVFAFALTPLIARKIYPLLIKALQILNLHISNEKLLIFLAYFVSFSLIFAFFRFLSFVLIKFIKFLRLRFIDRIAGAVLGFIKASVIVMVITLVIDNFFPFWAGSIKRAKLYPYIKKEMYYTQKILPFSIKEEIRHLILKGRLLLRKLEKEEK